MGLVSELVILPIIFKTLQHAKVIKQTKQVKQIMKSKHNDSAFGQWRKTGDHMHSSQKWRQQQSLKYERKRNKHLIERENYIHSYVHYTVCNYATWQNTSWCQRPFMAPVTNLPRMVHIGVKKHTQAEPIRNCTTGHIDAAASLSIVFKWE